MIKNYKKENIGPCKYKFRLGEIFKHKKIDLVDVEHNIFPELIKLKLPYVLKPGEFVIGRTIEEFDTPIDLMSIYAASSLSLRIGLNVLVTKNKKRTVYIRERAFRYQIVIDNSFSHLKIQLLKQIILESIIDSFDFINNKPTTHNNRLHERCVLCGKLLNILNINILSCCKESLCRDCKNNWKKESRKNNKHCIFCNASVYFWKIFWIDK